MKVLKPSRLSLVTRSYEVNRQCYFGLSILAFFDVESGRLLREADMWTFAAEELGKDGSVDAGIPKTRAEYLVSGSAYPPGGEEAPTCPVTVKVGELQKTLYVIGDRFWKETEQTQPQPFTSMPITWDRAFGGPELARNPVGKGAGPVETEHGPVQFLPNVELPDKMITSPKQHPEPAGFGMIDITRPQRFSKVGTYDRKWLKELFPGFARDIDWTIHNAAPEDQQQDEPFVGDEAISCFNMHPERPEITGALPGIKARGFVTQRVSEQGEEQLLELPMQLTTVWLFPHVLKGIVVFQGTLPVKEDDGADILHLLIGAEEMDVDKGVAHYRQVLEHRLDPDRGALYSLRDEDLLPPIPPSEGGDSTDEDAALIAVEGLLGQNLRKRAEAEIDRARELAASYGLDPDEHAPLPLEPEESLPDDPLELQEHIEKVQKEAEEKVAAKEQQIQEIFEQYVPVLESVGVDPETIRAELTDARVGPPGYTVENELERIRRLADECWAMGLKIGELEQWLEDEELHQSWRDIEQQLREGYLTMAHKQGPVPPRAAEESDRLRQEVLDACLGGRSMAYHDLSGANLSGMDLEGANFRQGWLDTVDLRGANLEDADFSEAVLARAELSEAVLKNTSFRGANLGGATLTGVKIEGGVDLTDATLDEAELGDATLDGVTLSGAMLMEMDFTTASLRGIAAKNVNFYKCDLRGTSFAGAALEYISFIECDLRGADFQDATVKTLTFVSCKAAGASFFRVRGTGFVAVLCEPFAECDFRGAALESLNLREVDLRGSDLSGAVLNGSELSGAILSEAKLYRAELKKARLVRADLTEADLTSVNAMEADFSKADIRGTKLIGANLFGANFGRVRSDEATDLHNSNQTRVTVYPLRQE